MRIAATFIAPPRFLRVALIVPWCFVGILTMAGMWLVADGLRTRAEVPILERRLAVVERQRTQSVQHAASLPAQDRLQVLAARVQTLNAMSVVRGWATSEALLWLEAHMPAAVQLVSLHHKARTGEMTLVAETRNPSAMTAFIAELEDEPRFANVLLSKQAAQRGSADGRLQFEVKVVLK